MELKQLQSFVAVVKYENFTKAAEKTFASQPTISAHIRALEEELNTQLIIRNTKKIEVTERGRELYSVAKNILDLESKLINKWQASGNEMIQIGASTVPSGYILPEVLPGFREENPDAQFSITQGDSKEVLDCLERGQYDLGIVGMASQNLDLVFEPFCEEKMVLITPNGRYYSELMKNGFPTEALKKEPFILREEGSGSGKSAVSLMEALGMPEDELNVTARINDQESIKNLVAAGLGVAVISERAVADYAQSGKLQAFNLPGDSTRRFYLAYRKNVTLSEKTTKFIDYIKDYYNYGQE